MDSIGAARREVEKVKPLTERQRQAQIALFNELIDDLRPGKIGHEPGCPQHYNAPVFGKFKEIDINPRVAQIPCTCWTAKAATWLKLERFALLTDAERREEVGQ